jgi:AraC-like DNA-binding protein
MQKAAELLSARGLTVREVTHRVGYRQPAQFAKAFRRHFGSAPSDYRAESARNARFGRASVGTAARAA